MARLSVTELRNKLYKVMDHVITTGIPQEVYKNGHRLKIVLDDKKKSKLDNLCSHNAIVGNPKDLVNIKVWEWNKGKDL